MRSTTVAILGAAALVSVLAVARLGAQEPPSILPALLAEVRGLRAAMEQMASAGPRVQLALGRLQLQEQRVNNLIRRLQETRDALAAAQQSYQRSQEQIAQFERATKDAPAADREQMGHMVGIFRGEMARTAAEVQRLTAEEAAVATDIATEQNRWSEFNQRLEELERTLAVR